MEVSEALNIAIGGVKQDISRQFSLVHKNINKVAIQPPRQMWQATLQRTLRRGGSRPLLLITRLMEALRLLLLLQVMSFVTFPL